MALELTLSFAEIVGVAAPMEHRVTVTLTDRPPITIPFTSPFTKEDWEDMQWYIESYPVQYAADVDDDRAARIVAKLKVWGQGLFQAVFSDRDAERIFNAFQDAEGEGRQITIAASQPEILRLPWELLCDPSGTYLLHENPRIAVRRQLAGAEGGRKPVEVRPKAQLRLLMVVSRPDGAGFLDPRAEGQAVLQAIAQTAPGRVVVEFLRPATLTKLVERLENRQLPAIDIVHFDGHGTFATNGEAGTGKHDDGLTKGSQPQGMGYLVFEDEDGKKQPISATELGEALNRQKVSLMVLSACQSAMVTGDDALGCVAARLTHSGIPAVLAMTYSVLMTTTEQLFGKFYGELAGGESLGVALANARRDLFMRKRRGDRWRGTTQIELELSDWFLPAWYQAGGDIKLLKKVKTLPQIESPKHRLPELAEEGFFGRSRELWQIERAFVQGTRRITIAGFGGQGKTYLAVEAGRWLAQTGMFDAVCFVDYAAFQGMDAVGVAVSTIGVVLEQSFIDAAAVTKALAERRTLIILDNLESLAAKTLQELLTEANKWSQVGATRLLLTTRDGGLSHADYPAANSRLHQLLSLSGLGNERQPEDALRYFQGLMKLPPVPKWDLPERVALIELFKLVDFHPLSIKLVAYQLKERRVGDLARSLETLLAAEPQADKQRCLVASLNLSLQRLEADLLAVLPRLGVFQGGAFEFMILEVLQFAPEHWQKLKIVLLRNGLMQVEVLENVVSPFLRFHPTLAPVLWRRLSESEQANLRLLHQQNYRDFVIDLYQVDMQNPSEARSTIRLELPNLLWAVKGALESRSEDAVKEDAVKFVERLNMFLHFLGLKRDRAFLSERLSQFINKVDSTKWISILTLQGDLLLSSHQYSDATEVFDKIIQELDSEPSFTQTVILSRLGICHQKQIQLSEAANFFQKGLDLSDRLEQGEHVKRQQGILQVHLGSVLMDLGHFPEAEQAYKNSLAIAVGMSDLRGISVAKGWMGNLAMRQGNLITAEKIYKELLEIFKELQEPESEANTWHQLGRVYQKMEHWKDADHAFRESARINEQQVNKTELAIIYGQLAIICQNINQPIEAEAWYSKSLESSRLVGDRLGEFIQLNNFANFLSSQPMRIPEAKKLVQKALAIAETIDNAEIWKTYDILAKIAIAQNEPDKAKEYRHLARTTKAAFAGTQDELQQHAPLIELVVAAVGDAATREQLEPELVQGVGFGRGQLVAAIRRVWAGEREVEVLWADLDANDSMIIAAILRGL
jgi:tetratricopeptide (TPR) repeat protein